ncbi:MAG: SH3 domain-containing protein [Candidatus Doudnabacteria bacterium]|nr:SH3 domain-containing protein [bacterium]MDZ4244045.1 SH3 domain-containing protein [Candidatus Doudnabacteria bacterium]
MPPNKVRKKTDINIHRISEHRLLDPKLRDLKRAGSSKTFYIIMAVGLFIVGAVFGYIYYKSPVPSAGMPEIIVPNEAPTTSSDTPSAPETQSTEPKVEKQMVSVLDTPTGYLNVRLGPGTNFEKIGQVNPGESYELIIADEAVGWYQIKLDETRNGWVTKQYAEVK